LPAADRIRLQDLIAQGSAKNKHVELRDFYFGTRFIHRAGIVMHSEDGFVLSYPLGMLILVWSTAIMRPRRNMEKGNFTMQARAFDYDTFMTLAELS
jgi:hypothetical protein